MHNGFTSDVITLLTRCESERLPAAATAREIGDDEAVGRELCRALIAGLSPTMINLPPFIQQIVGRALMEEVDWKAVAVRIKCPPELN